MIPGETILTGASPTCEDCGETPPFAVLRSGAGFYIGTMCACGPYSRESGYYATASAAQAELDAWSSRGVVNGRPGPVDASELPPWARR